MSHLECADVNLGLLVYRLEVQESHIAALEESQKALKEELNEVKNSAQKQERKQLLAGVSFLGAVIMTLLGFIWNYRLAIFKG